MFSIQGFIYLASMSMREKQGLIKHILECSRICSKLKQCFFIDKQCNMMIINWQSVYESVQCRSFYYEILSLIVINHLHKLFPHVHTKNIENNLRILSGLLNTS